MSHVGQIKRCTQNIRKCSDKIA